MRLREKRHEVPARSEPLHRLVGRPGCEAARSVEHLRQQRDVADGVEKDARPAERPVHGQVDVALLAQGLFFWPRLLFGVVVPIVLTAMIWSTLKLKHTQAATGLLYLAILTAFGTDLVARALLS